MNTKGGVQQLITQLERLKKAFENIEPSDPLVLTSSIADKNEVLVFNSLDWDSASLDDFIRTMDVIPSIEDKAYLYLLPRFLQIMVDAILDEDEKWDLVWTFALEGLLHHEQKEDVLRHLNSEQKTALVEMFKSLDSTVFAASNSVSGKTLEKILAEMD